jgi:hypothetical protein
MKLILILFSFIIISQPSIAFNAQMLEGKWINSDLDQLQITVRGKQITLTRDLKSEGIRPSMRRTYQGTFKANFIPLYARPDNIEEMSEFLSKPVRQKLIDSNQREDLMLKILNKDNIRIDYHPAIVNFDTHSPNKISSIETENEVIRYKRWGRFRFGQISVFAEDPIVQAKKHKEKLQQKRQSIESQQLQLQQKKQQNAEIPAAGLARQDIISIHNRLLKLNKQLTDIQTNPVKPIPEDAEKTTRLINERNNHIRELKEQIELATGEINKKAEWAKNQQYEYFSTFVTNEYINNGLLSFTEDLQKINSDIATQKYHPERIEAISISQENQQKYVARRERTFKVPAEVEGNKKVFQHFAERIHNQITPKLKTLEKDTISLINKAANQLKELDNKEMLQPEFSTKLAKMDNTQTVSSDIFPTCLPVPKELAHSLFNKDIPINQPWLADIQSISQALMQNSNKHLKINQKNRKFVMQGSPMQTKISPTRKNWFAEIEKLAQLRILIQKTWFDKIDSIKKSKKKKITKRANQKNAKNAYIKQTSKNTSTLNKLWKSQNLSLSINLLQGQIESLQDIQQNLKKLINKPEMWSSACAIKNQSDEILMILKAMQSALLQAIADHYWQIQSQLNDLRLVELLYLHHDNQLNKNIEVYSQRSISENLSIKRNSPFQKPETLTLTLWVRYLAESVPTLKMQTRYQGIEFSIEPTTTKLSESSLPGVKEVKYTFSDQPFKNTDMRDKPTLEIDFRSW